LRVSEDNRENLYYHQYENSEVQGKVVTVAEFIAQWVTAQVQAREVRFFWGGGQIYLFIFQILVHDLGCLLT
jgi:hypothetical protein